MLGVNGGSEPARRLRIRVAKFVAIRTRLYLLDLSSLHPCKPLVLISTAQCVAGLRRKRASANVRTLSLGSPFRPEEMGGLFWTQVVWQGLRSRVVQHAEGKRKRGRMQDGDKGRGEGLHGSVDTHSLRRCSWPEAAKGPRHALCGSQSSSWQRRREKKVDFCLTGRVYRL